MGAPATGRSALRQHVTRVADTVWEIPPTAKPGMRVPARIYATEQLLAQMDDGVFEQVANVAMLPGIVGHSFCMPDGHWGYGFPIGGLAAMDPDHGVISPGGLLMRYMTATPHGGLQPGGVHLAEMEGLAMKFLPDAFTAIDEILDAVENALLGCPTPIPTP
jgi:hypothetical protein